MAQKQKIPNPLFAEKKIEMHSEDWNSRFWVEKIPEYKPKSLISFENKPSANIKTRKKLPKIDSAHFLINEHLPRIEQPSEQRLKKMSENLFNSEMPFRPIFKSNLPSPNQVKHFQDRISKNILKNDKNTKKKNYSSKIGYKSSRISLDINAKTLKKGVPYKSIPSLNSKSLKISLSPNHFPTFSTNFLGLYLPEHSDLIENCEKNDASSNSSIEDQATLELNSISKEFCETYCQELTANLVKLTAVESYHEIISAHLILFSSHILDFFLIEVIDFFAQTTATEVHHEYTDIEYIDFKQEIIDSVFEAEILSIVEFYNFELISLDIFKDYIDILPITELVNESICEEKIENLTISASIWTRIIDSIIEEEWVEILAEDEISNYRLEQIWKTFPQNLLKEISKTHSQGISQRVCESIYFEILNEFVGGIWTKTLVLSVLQNKDSENLENIMPIRRLRLYEKKY